jgi:hypothetical protein
LIYFFEEEDAISLRFVVGFNYPCGIWIFLKFIEKDGVLIYMESAILGKVKVVGKNSMWIEGPPQTSSFAM